MTKDQTPRRLRYDRIDEGLKELMRHVPAVSHAMEIYLQGECTYEQALVRLSKHLCSVVSEQRTKIITMMREQTHSVIKETG